MSEFMAGLKRTARVAEITKEYIGKEVTLMGWVQKARNKGFMVFVPLRDRSGVMQVLMEEANMGAEDFAKAAALRSEDCIAVIGTVQRRTEKDINLNMKTGELEIIATALKVFSKSEVLPFPIEENVNINENARMKYRYLDLRRPNIQRNLIMKSKISMATRRFFESEGFLEIETPILTKSTPEGARDYLVPSRVNQGNFYALPQSPQLFKQLLMMSGYDRYFQIARCFRDEDLRADRQPEFTQVDMELSFVEQEDIMEIQERYMQSLFKEVLNVDVAIPFPKMPYRECMENYGSDKPDTRFDMKLKNITDIFEGTDFVVFKNAIDIGGSIRAVVAKTADMPRKQLDALTLFVKTYKAKGLATFGILNGEYKSSIMKFVTEEQVQSLVKRLDLKEGDMAYIVADKNSVVLDALGALRIELAKKLDLLDPAKFNFLWVTEFPMFQYSEEENRYVAEHHPFTCPMDEDLDLLDTDPLKVRTKAYDLALNGVELGGGSIRIHSSSLQSKIFDIIGMDKEVASTRFGFLLEALKYGVPPHGGLAYGLDRIVMLMLGLDNIRECIAFPKDKSARCIMTEAPSYVEDKQLDELAILVNEEILKREENIEN